ncbi:hypothetical protein [Deinococcus sp.]|uniref:hypothetical protein n=1 Tax=Deinococcus sp. TaxID=47478 RepID=UPI0028699F7A|nr:hypothetical protein [Deinococcus sp.]
MATYRIFLEAVSEARVEVQALLDSAPPGTVCRHRFAPKPVVLGEDAYLQLDVVLSGAQADEFSAQLKQRFSTDMQRVD